MQVKYHHSSSCTVAQGLIIHLAFLTSRAVVLKVFTVELLCQNKLHQKRNTEHCQCGHRTGRKEVSKISGTLWTCKTALDSMQATHFCI
jgi:hypothetical protein